MFLLQYLRCIELFKFKSIALNINYELNYRNNKNNLHLLLKLIVIAFNIIFNPIFVVMKPHVTLTALSLRGLRISLHIYICI